uniref:Vitronectin n=1 Tax=Ficedula albicollis TaxID=59894 RepID=A0A803VSS7_FICAL
MLGLCCAPARTVAGGLRSRTPSMRLLFPALVLALLATTHAAEDSCEGRCDEGFDSGRKCQCDTLCVYYQSCCSDYSTVCKAKVTRGDVFALPEDDYLDYNLTVDFVTDEAPVADPTELPTTPVLVDTTPESKPNPGETLPEVPATPPAGSEEPEELCSGKPFDAFTDLKNGSLYAFRGKYFYELDKTSVRPGYPKLISDVWGIEGPIDAAFTRINCQGKTYLFKVGCRVGDTPRVGSTAPQPILYPLLAPPMHTHAVVARYPKSLWLFWDPKQPQPHDGAPQHPLAPPGRPVAGGCCSCNPSLSPTPQGTQYWRFDDGALDPGYPRDISEGFEGIPDNVDAAFALPAHSYHGNERVYFFKDKYYWSYDFAQQPTQADCEKSSPSTVFKHYAFMNRDSWEDVFQLLFGGRMPGANGPWYISRDWRGVPSRLDAAMAGRIYVASHQPRRRKSRRQRKRYNHHGSLNLGFWSWLQNDPDSAGVESDGLSGSTCEMLQSVYFFVGDKYYRVNLRTKRVDLVRPRYPRSIAQYWLDCPQPTEST